MLVPVEVLALVAVAIVLLVGAVAAQVRTERRLRARLAARTTAERAGVVDPSAPEPPPHVHVWAEKPVGYKVGMGIYPCTVPGCRAEPLCHAGRR